MNLATVEANAERIRAMMHDLCPAAVANAEALSDNVRYFAASSFGHTPIKIGPGEYVPDPAKLQPQFVEAPVLWILSQLEPSPLSPAPRDPGNPG